MSSYTAPEPTSTPPLPFPTSGSLDPYVNYLKGYLTKLNRYDGGDQSLGKAIQQGLHENIEELTTWNITSADNFCYYANYLLTSWTPSEEQDGRFIYKVLTVFYYIFDRPALQDLQTPIQLASIQADMPIITPLSNWIVGYAKRMGSWLSTPGSLTAETYKTFLTADCYRMGNPTLDYKIPDPSSPTGGFQNFNELFCRFLVDPQPPNSTVRPVAQGDQIVVFPADSTFDNAWPIDDNLKVKIKDPDAPDGGTSGTQTLVDVKTVLWPLSALLAGSAYQYKFKDGTWAHIFLNAFDYHRQHAPVAGMVVEAFLVEGCAYLQVKAKKDPDGKWRLKPHRDFHKPMLRSAGDVVKVETDAPDGAGYQFIQQRGCIMIDTTGYANVGMVAVLPMGMAQVSSVKLSVQAGATVQKGQEISWFEFGGSDLVLVFEEQAKVGNWPPSTDPRPHHLMGEALCTLHSSTKK